MPGIKPLGRSNRLRIGVCFNGRQSPGGQNSIEGLLRFAKHSNSTILGFIGGT